MVPLRLFELWGIPAGEGAVSFAADLGGCLGIRGASPEKYDYIVTNQWHLDD